ncbi:hypothetical protein Back11_05900 [Paenibacillus baekrokdamisoli]|uniref:Uncharacterized protein n=1 Tax=Paenibacillus baekrokdamisoli TaxID=1712516 RepID=A0A3G9IT75_9BACL|nr:hypothetical protein [Paenibacillus baekrokdamisoli]MBB3067570.1 hypothetical protein [Paenibacillus baekrokdamisoli]BBH19245.1 hypothetical protein Back11_05900 [Paenibacillus baekrokdamisoli]
MNQYKLSDIAIQIAIHSFLKETKQSDEHMKQTLAYLYKTIDIIGTNNSALRNPLNLDESVFYFRDRENPLTGQEIITGDYLIFDYIGHNGDMFIKQFNSIDELEEEITGSGGITNTFTTYQIAIVMGKVRHYNITFTNGNDGQEYNFVKDVHDALPEYNYEEEIITNVKIHWLD